MLSHKARARACLAAVAAAITLVAFTVVHPKAAPGTALRDFEAYYAAGATWTAGGDPYGRDVWRIERGIPGVVATRDELLPFVGPPFGLPLWAALARLPWRFATIVWGTVLALSVAGIIFVNVRAHGARGDAVDALALLTLCCCFGPLTSGVALGQVAVVSCAAIASLAWPLASRRTWPAAACALIAALQPNLAPVITLRAGSRKTWFVFGGAALAAAGASLVVLGGWPGAYHYLTVLREHADSERFIAIQTTVAGTARAFGTGEGASAALALTATLCVGAIVAFQALSRRYAPDERVLLGCAALPLALPFAHEHDFTIALLPAMATLRRGRGVAWIVAAIATEGIAVDWLGLAQRPATVWFAALVACAAALAMAALAAGPLRARHFVPALMAPVILLAGTIAAAHRLPVWPDALASNFHVSASLRAAQVWREEQVRSGIGALDPWWGALRSVSLVSCALLWLCASVALQKPADARVARRAEWRMQ